AHPARSPGESSGPGAGQSVGGARLQQDPQGAFHAISWIHIDCGGASLRRA
ncbi:unnamed protein product, partial [Symbiodinium pilosum]